jgi:hypothetical protein
VSTENPWDRPEDHPEHVAWRLVVLWANERRDPAPRPGLGLDLVEQYADLIERIAGVLESQLDGEEG